MNNSIMQRMLIGQATQYHSIRNTSEYHIRGLVSRTVSY